MPSINKVILVGTVGRDAELRGNGKVLTFSIVTNEKYKSGDEWVQKTEWHNIVVFGGAVNYLANKITKGKMVYVDGRIESSKYTDKSGAEKKSINIVSNAVSILDKSDYTDDSENDPPVKSSKAPSKPSVQSKARKEPVDDDLDDDDIPF